MHIKPSRTMNPAPVSAASTAAPSRRQVLKVSGAGALVLALLGTQRSLAAASPGGDRAVAAVPGDAPRPMAFVRVAPDNTVTLISKHLDMGQGITTGLATIVAEELDADWGQMRVEFAPANAQLYNNLDFGPVQGTGGSNSIHNSWMQLRKAGAAARSMLVNAAAQAWALPAAEIAVDKGVLSHRSGRRATFGEFAAKAAAMPVPLDVTLKDPKDFRLIGTAVHRLDHISKTDGTAVYALDIRRPGMLTAVLQRPSPFGATIRSVDDKAARAIRGVVDVVTVPQGVAVLAENTWAARQGRDALKIEWDDAKAERRSSADMLADYKALAAKPGLVALRQGDAEQALGRPGKVVRAEFALPYVAHAPMEPLNATVEKAADGSYDFYAGSQQQTIEQAVAAGVLGVKPDQVRIHTTWAGGSFGRRSTPVPDYFAELAAIMKATGGERPVHLVYTREDDITGGYYRPMFFHAVEAALDADGQVAAWKHRAVGQTFFRGTFYETVFFKEGVDEVAVEGILDMPYAIPNRVVEWHDAPSPVTTSWWRSVGHSHTAQAIEVTMDELAQAAGKSPLDFRLAMLKDKPRHAGVLRLAAEKSGFGRAMPTGQGQGIAMHETFNTYVAMVAEVSVANGTVRVDRIVVAVDCGVAVNPDVIKAQMEGGVGFGLGAALRNQITFDKGVVQQANFDSYQPLRMSDMPKVEVHIVPSAEFPTGVGEAGVPPVAPAVSNAVFAATGKRLRSLPFDFDSLRGA